MQRLSDLTYQHLTELPRHAVCALVASIGISASTALAIAPNLNRQVAAPVRLPPVARVPTSTATHLPTGTKMVATQNSQPQQPWLFVPIEGDDFSSFHSAPPVELELGKPVGATATVGGWIGAGVGRGGLAQ